MKHFIYSNFAERRNKYREISHFAEDFIASDTSRNEIQAPWTLKADFILPHHMTSHGEGHSEEAEVFPGLKEYHSISS